MARDYKGKNLLLVSVLKGSVLFMADLMREIKVPCTIDFMAVSSYGSGVKTSGVVKIIKDLDTDVVEGADLLIVEDILDTGFTLSFLYKLLEEFMEIFRQYLDRYCNIRSGYGRLHRLYCAQLMSL